jgi:hypothetical protein
MLDYGASREIIVVVQRIDRDIFIIEQLKYIRVFFAHILAHDGLPLGLWTKDTLIDSEAFSTG